MAQNGDDSLSLFPPSQAPDPSPSPSPSPPSSEIRQKLHLITKEFANFPLSPGDGPGLQFVGDHLGDTLAAEFGEADERSPDAGSNGPIPGPPEEVREESERQQVAVRDLMNGARERDSIVGNAAGNGIENDSSEKDGEARPGSGAVEQVVLNREIELVEESSAPGESGSSLKGPPDVSRGGGAGIHEGHIKGTSSSANEVVKHHFGGHIDTTGDTLYNIPTGDEEGRSRQRILAFAAKRYAGAVERNPQDYDALYNWALVLQESADNIGGEATTKDQLLGEACKKYEEATRLCPTLHEAFYNWAIAISDRAKIRGRTKEAEELWKQACKNYERAVQLNWNSPQALNNWGLALQELSGIVPIRDKQLIVRTSIKKFRVAIQLQFDFHRAIYNLGTVLYGLAEDTFRSGRQVGAKESTPSDLYSQSAIYIAAAHALKPEYPVYKSALRLVRSMLPLPYVKIGQLTVSPYGDSLAPHSDWKRHWFVLDHEALYQVEKTEQKMPGQSPRRLSGITSESSGVFIDQSPSLRVEIADIAQLSSCADLSIPSGAGFCIDTVYGQHYLVADTWEAVDGWVDAIRLVYTIYVRGQSDILAGIIAG